VLAWVFERCDDQGGTEKTAIGLVPSSDSLDTSGLDLSDGAVEKLLRVDADEWRDQLPRLHEHFAQFGDKLPDELAGQLDALESRLGDAG
jgi:phosphoenolpyruvate carboxykinase (GTP)